MPPERPEIRRRNPIGPTDHVAVGRDVLDVGHVRQRRRDDSVRSGGHSRGAGRNEGEAGCARFRGAGKRLGRRFDARMAGMVQTERRIRRAS